MKTASGLPLPLRIEWLETRIAPAAAVFNLSDLNGTNGFTFNGESQNDGVGTAVSSIGDLNGDLVDDFVIGAPEAGELYVVFGQPGGFLPTLDPGALNGTNGFKILGETPSSEAGASVSGGDVNGDGLEDLVIGAPNGGSFGNTTGAAYLLLGRASFPPTVSLTPGAFGVTKFVGEAIGDLAGFSISATGDFNNDGKNDILIGAPNANGPGGAGIGAAYLVYGATSYFGPFNLGSLNTNNGYKIQGLAQQDNAGTSVSFTGDLNKDGYDELAIGAPGADSGQQGAGSVYLVFGRSSDITIPITLNGLNGTTGFRVDGEAAGDGAGAAISGAGDLNRDSFDDFIIGAPNAPGGEGTGAAYVIYGNTGFQPSFDLSSVAGSVGFKIVGETEGFAAASVASAGDFNRDGIVDLIIGAPRTASNTGAAYLLLGSPTGFSDVVDLSALDGNNGFKLVGSVAQALAGVAVSSAGDVNSDGFDDLLISTVNAAGLPAAAGAVHVVFGFDTRVNMTDDGKTITFTESDGDIVTLKLSIPGLNAQDITLAPDGSIQSLDLTSFAPPSPIGGNFRLLNVTIGVKTAPGGIGDGFTKLGLLNATGVPLGKLKLQGDLGRLMAGLPGAGAAAKSVFIAGNFGTVTGTVALSELFGSVGKFTVGGDFLEDSVAIAGKVKSLKVAGNFVGDPSLSIATLADIAEDGFGSDAESLGVIPGGVFRADSIGRIKFGLGMKGGGIAIGKDIGVFSIDGDLQRGHVFAGGGIKALKVAGKITSSDPGEPVNITARNKIGAIIVNNDVENARILAGYNTDGDPVNPDAVIGKILVKGNWIASSVAAGIEDSTNDGFGRNDTVISGDISAAISKIGSIVIKGTASGSAAAGDHFGITAQRIGKVSIDGALVPLTAATDDILADTTNNDFRVVEI